MPKPVAPSRAKKAWRWKSKAPGAVGGDGGDSTA
jgi:hypothetical protein